MATPKRKRRSRRDTDQQLSLAIAWLSEDDFARALHVRGAKHIRTVRFKNNRSRMISLSRDRLSLNIHVCFQSATTEVLDAVAAFIRLPQRSVEYRHAVERMRAWWEGQALPMFNGHGKAGVAGACCGTEEQRRFLKKLYAQLNETRFRDRLPRRLPLRLSNRMSRRFGHVYYRRKPLGGRAVEEIALNVDLMLHGNERHLVDTLVHEMAHAEAWLLYGHRGHGEPWRRIAERVRCEPKACSHVRIRRRPTPRAAVTGVPSIDLRRVR